MFLGCGLLKKPKKKTKDFRSFSGEGGALAEILTTKESAVLKWWGESPIHGQKK